MTEQQQLISHLSGFVTERRLARMREVLAQRTRYITVCLEDIYQPHNASAVLRTCDCFGIQDVHIIENRNRFTTNPTVELGTAQWLSLMRYRAGDTEKSAQSNGSAGSAHGNAHRNSRRALLSLRRDGYRIVGTTPHTDDVELEQLDLDAGPVALVFGNELEGISDEVRELADEFVRIPMHGFAESFNISVSAAIALHHLSWRLRSGDEAHLLSEQEQEDVLLEWLRGSIQRIEQIERDYYAKRDYYGERGSRDGEDE